jgi:hypothetical protein
MGAVVRGRWRAVDGMACALLVDRGCATTCNHPEPVEASLEAEG